MTVLATSKYSVLLDTSIEKISGSSFPNITAYPRDVSHQVVGDDGFFIIASNGKNFRPNTFFYFVLTEYRVLVFHVWAVGSLFRETWDCGVAVTLNYLREYHGALLV